MTPLSAAVVICAYTERRWDDLRAAVASALAQEPAPRRVVLVVDHHPGLAARCRAELAVEVLENVRRRGLSGARNTALAHLADGAPVDVVAFLDDDAGARPGWLAGLLAPYADPAVAATGGTAVPRWPGGTAPDLLPRELWWVVGCTYTGQHPGGRLGGGERAEVRNVMGCSMSFRRGVLDRVGEFTEDMGRVGTVPLGCEETELCIRIRQALPGARIVLEPAAVVDHHVSGDRTDLRYLLRRAHAEGLSKAVLARAVGAGDGLAAERSYTRSVLPAALWRELRAAGRAVAGRRVGAAGGHLRAAAALPTALAAAGSGYLRGRAARGVAGRGSRAPGPTGAVVGTAA